VADILHDLPIAAPAARVFEMVSAPSGLDRWWSLHAEGTPEAGATYALDFGPGYVDWRARVTSCEPSRTFELQLVTAMPDWERTRIRFELDAAGRGRARYERLARGRNRPPRDEASERASELKR